MPWICATLFYLTNHLNTFQIWNIQQQRWGNNKNCGKITILIKCGKLFVYSWKKQGELHYGADGLFVSESLDVTTCTEFKPCVSPTPTTYSMTIFCRKEKRKKINKLWTIHGFVLLWKFNSDDALFKTHVSSPSNNIFPPLQVSLLEFSLSSEDLIKCAMSL